MFLSRLSWQERLLLPLFCVVFCGLVLLRCTGSTGNLHHHDDGTKSSLFRSEQQPPTPDPSESKSPPPPGLSTAFPALDDVREMASLSTLVYAFRFVMDDDAVCKNINNGPASITRETLLNGAEDYDYIDKGIIEGIYCHWYRHDHATGAQVMIVSSIAKSYLAVVFAGTDDWKTTLTDTDIAMKPFGVARNSSHSTTIPPTDEGDDVRIHEGFNTEVFGDAMFDQIMTRVDPLRRRFDRLFTTGHSLGAADSVITAVGMALHFEKKQKATNNNNNTIPTTARTDALTTTNDAPALSRADATKITSINFGCPFIGKSEWREYVHHADTMSSVGIWRLVLGWDLVPRLPALMEHVGHTVQLDWNTNIVGQSDATATAYYQHYGDETLGYAGVPMGWMAKPFIFIPGAMYSHSIVNYIKFVQDWPYPTLLDGFARVDDDDNDDRDNNLLTPVEEIM